MSASTRKLGRVPLLNLVEVAAISVVRVEGFAVAELGEFLRKLVFVFDRHGGGRSHPSVMDLYCSKAGEARCRYRRVPFDR